MTRVLWLIVLAGCPDVPTDTPPDASTEAALEFRTLPFSDEGFFRGRWMSAYGESFKPIARGGEAPQAGARWRFRWSCFPARSRNGKCGPDLELLDRVA